MIPNHLKGKNATEILQIYKKKFWSLSYPNNEDRTLKYIEKLEACFLMSIEDSLRNAAINTTAELDSYTSLFILANVKDRSIAYLNAVISYVVKELTYEEKVEKIAELGDFTIHYRLHINIGNRILTRYWINQPYVEIKESNTLLGCVSGNGNTPEKAIEDHWNKLTNLREHEYIVIDTGTARRRCRWNGEKWERINERL